MTGKQTTVMWLGLLLIVTRLFTTRQFHDIWSEIVSGATGKTGGTSGKHGGGGWDWNPLDHLPPLFPNMLPISVQTQTPLIPTKPTIV